jgi:hypothetical protein
MVCGDVKAMLLTSSSTSVSCAYKTNLDRPASEWILVLLDLLVLLVFIVGT